MHMGDDDLPDLHGETICDSDSDPIPIECTEEDEILLNCTYDYEVALWRRTKSLFNCAPFDLFPKGIRAASDHWDGYAYEDRFIKNDTSLTVPLCKSLCTLACFPFFEGDIEFVKYALSTALKTRCGDKTPPHMEGYNCWRSFESGFASLEDDLPRFNLFLDKSQLDKLKTALEFHTNLLSFPNKAEFVNEELFKKVLKSTWTLKEKGDLIHLMNHDVTTIIKAWDIWNKESRRNFPTMEESKNTWQKLYAKDMKVPRDTVLGWKKDWFFETRLEAKKKLAAKKRPESENERDDEDQPFEEYEDGFEDRDDLGIHPPSPKDNSDPQKDSSPHSVLSPVLGDVEDEDAEIVQHTESMTAPSKSKSHSNKVQTIEVDLMDSSNKELKYIEYDKEPLVTISEITESLSEFDISHGFDLHRKFGNLIQCRYYPTQIPTAWEVNYEIPPEFDLGFDSTDISFILSMQNSN